MTKTDKKVGSLLVRAAQYWGLSKDNAVRRS